jgi:hypothetical protein
MKMFKKDGKTAVLVSPGFGAGFSTWNSSEMAVDFDLVEAFLKGDMTRFEYIVNEKYGENLPYLGGVDSLEVEWVDEGNKFRVEEYDGYESLEVFDEKGWFTA